MSSKHSENPFPSHTCKPGQKTKTKTKVQFMMRVKRIFMILILNVVIFNAQSTIPIRQDQNPQRHRKK